MLPLQEAAEGSSVHTSTSYVKLVSSHIPRTTRYFSLLQVFGSSDQKKSNWDGWQQGLHQHPVFIFQVALFLPHSPSFLWSILRSLIKQTHTKPEEFPLTCESVSRALPQTLQQFPFCCILDVITLALIISFWNSKLYNLMQTCTF